MKVSSSRRVTAECVSACVRIDAVVSHGQFRSSTPSFVMRRTLFQLRRVDVRGDGGRWSSGRRVVESSSRLAV